jgi:hypothetical protein
LGFLFLFLQKKFPKQAFVGGYSPPKKFTFWGKNLIKKPHFSGQEDEHAKDIRIM